MENITFGDLMGKTLLVGFTYYTEDDVFIEQKQFWGSVTHCDSKKNVIRQKNGELLSLPPDLRSTEVAKPGYYRLQSTGDVVVNPDYLSTWICHRPNMEVQK